MHQYQRHHSKEREMSPSPPSSAISSARVVDIDAIELEKENIQPIRQGRSAQVLSRLFTAQHDDRAHELALHHQRFQAELERIHELKDPMDVYMRYVGWTIECYPQSGAQGHDSRLVSLLEQAIEQFKEEERYRNDPRFVKLLILYSEKIEYPVDVFTFMETNKIGSEIAMFYEEHADYLESREEFDKAKDVFLLGIYRRARPCGRLKRLFEEFERRAELHQQELQKQALDNLASEPPHQRPRPALDPSISMSTTVNRRVLGTKISGSESMHVNETTRGHVPIGSNSSSSSASSSRPSNTSSYKRPNSKLQIFSDQAAPSSSSGRQGPAQGPQSSEENTPWRDLGVEQVRRKENLREAISWKGTRLTAEDALPRRSHPKLQVYRDPDDAFPEQQSRKAASPVQKEQHESVSNPSLQMPVLEESPTQLPPAEQVSTEQSELEATISRQSHNFHATPVTPSKHLEEQAKRFPITKGDRGGQERLMIDLKQIYVGKEEFSIEEIRSKRLRYGLHESHLENDPSSHRPAASTGGSDSGRRPRTQQQQDLIESSRHIPQTLQHQRLPSSIQPGPPQVPASSNPRLNRSPSSEGRRVSGSKRRLTSSPTLHTKYAFAEMNKIFSDRSRGRRSMDSQWSTEDSLDIDDNELDKFTMAYSIPGIPWDLSPESRDFLENEIQNEYDDDDQDGDGRTEKFVKKLEQGCESTITQDIEALKRSRAEEEGHNTRLSFRSNKRSSSRFDPGRRQSDITMVIQQRAQQMQQQQKQAQPQQQARVSRSSLGSSRLSSGGQTADHIHAIGDKSKQSYLHAGGAALPPSSSSSSSSSSAMMSKLQSRPFQVFRDDAENLDSDLNVPMLEDEAPPPFLDHEDPL